MSTTIDSRVLEMRFDNRQFEQGVSTTMSTLDKLKQKLNLTGASKGLDDLGRSAKNVDMSGLGRGVETVQAKFSALQVAGVTALVNITNSAVNAGKRMVKAFTIDPIKSGFQEYETQINSIQTILANTQKEGTNVERVNAALDELNTYADKTIYNFSEMTRNIGTFTAAGVKLDTSVNAIQGIANLAAVSGSTSQQASTAMYQLSQALASGTVKLMDWNSVVNAGMGGQVFQDALKETSRLLGTGADEAIKATGSFRESLREGWLTSEVLTETLKKFTTSGANEYVAEYTGLSKEAVEAALKSAEAQYGEAEAIDKASEALAKKSGKNKDEIKQALQFAKTAEDAATKVKTFTQLFDTLKEAAQSGWGKTWRLIVGDFDEAKNLFTSLSNFFGGFINKMSDARNNLLESALGKNFTSLVDKVKNVTEPIKKSADSVKAVVKSVKDYSKVVDEIIGGKWGDGEKRIEGLTKAGYDWAHAQNLVNEKLGSSVRHATDYSEAQEGVSESQAKTNTSTAKQIATLAKMSKAQLKAKGYTDEQIEAFRELAKMADKTGIPLEEFIENIDNINGRFLLLNSFKNIGNGIVSVFKAMGDAWRNIFPSMTADQLFDIIAAFHKFSTHLKLTDDNVQKLQRTFEGLFAVIHIITSIVGGGLKLAFRVLSEVLGKFDMNILDLTAGIGDMLVAIDNFITKNKFINTAIDIMATAIAKVIEGVRNLVDAFLELPLIQDFIEGFKEIWEKIAEALNSETGKGFMETMTKIKDAFNMPEGAAQNFKTIAEGIFSSLEAGAWKLVGSLPVALKVVKTVLEMFGTNLAEVTVKIAEWISNTVEWVKTNTPFIDGVNKAASVIKVLIEGIANCVKAFMELNVVGEIVDRFTGIFEKLFGSINNGIQTVNFQAFVDAISNAFTNIEKWIRGLKDSEHLGIDIVKGIANGIKTGVTLAIQAMVEIAQAVIETFCSLLGIHSPSTVAFEWGTNIIEGLSNGISAGINAIISVMGAVGTAIKNAWGKIHWEKIPEGIKTAFTNLYELFKGFDFEKLMALIPIGAALFMVKKIYDIADILADGIESINSVLKGVGSVIGGFAQIEKAFAQNIKAKALRNIALSIAILVGAVIALTFVDTDKLAGAVTTIVILAGVLTALAWAMGKLETASIKMGDGKISFDGLKTALVSLGLALLLLAATVKIIGSMDPEQAMAGFIGLTALVIEMGAFFAAYGLLVKGKAAKNMDKAGKMIRKLATSLLIMALVCKLVGMLTPGEMLKGVAFMTAFGLFVAAMMKATSGAKSKHINNIGKMVRNISLAMLLMIGVCKLAGMLTVEDMIKGGVFAAAFTIFVKYLVKASQIAKGQQIAKLGGLLLSISVSLLLMVGICKLVGMLALEDVIKGGVFVAAFFILVKKLVEITTIGDDAKMAKVGATILAFSIAIGLLAGVCILLSMLTVEGLAKGLTAITVLGLVMAAMVHATKGAQNIKASLIVMVVAIGIMAGVVATLSAIDFSRLAGATIALGTLMGLFALMTKSLKGIKKIKMGPIITLTLVVGALAGIIYLLRNVDPGSAIGSAVALSTLILAMSGVTKVLSTMSVKIGESLKGALALTSMAIPLLAFVGVLRLMNGVDVAVTTVLALVGLTTAMTLLLIPLSMIGSVIGYAISGVLALTTMAVPLLAFVGILKLMEGVDRATENVKALVVLAGALTLMLIPLTIIGTFVPSALAGVVALTAMAVPLLAFVGILKLMEGIDAAMTNAIAITMLMSTLGDVLFKISLVAPLALVAVAAINALVITIGAIGVLATAIGALMDKFPSIQNFLDTGLPVLEQLAGSIGTMVGNLIGNFGEAIGDSLVKIGNDIAAFMMALQVASLNASGIKGESFSGVKDLIGVMGDIAGMTVGTSVSDVFTLGGTSMEKFQTDAVAFFNAMKEISTVANGITIDETSFNAVISAAQKLADLQSSLEPIGGLMSWFKGRDDLASFGENVGQFFTSIKTAFASLEGVTINTEALNAVIDGSTKLATLQSSLEPIGGVISWFKGRDDLATFGTNVGQFFDSMKTAFTSLDGITVNSEALTAVIDASTKLATLQSSLENIGGVVDWFTGRDDLATFGTSVGLFMGSMKTAMATLDGVTVNAEALTSVIDAATKLAELQSSLENIGGVVDWFTGRDDLATFGTNIGQFAEAMGTLKEKMGEDGISEAVVASVTNAGDALIELDKALPEKGFFDKKVDLSEFSTYITDFATAIKDFNDKVKDIDSANMSIAIDAANKIKTLCDSLKDFDTSGVAKFTGIGTGGFGADGPISDIAEALADFCSKTADIDTGKLDITISAAKKLKTLISSLADLDTSGVENFKIDSIATAINDYYTKISAVDPAMLNLSIMSVMRLKSFISGLAGFDSTGVDSFKTAIDSLAQTNIQGFVTAFQGAAQTLSTVGTSMINSLVNGMRAGMAKLPSIASSIMTATITVFTSKAAVLSSAGIAMINGLVSGLASGIAKCVAIMSTLMTTLVSMVLSRTTALTPAGVAIINGFATGLSSGKARCISIVASLSAAISSAIVSKVSLFRSSGLAMTNGLAQGLTSGKSHCISVINSMIADMANIIRSRASLFTAGGAQCMERFASGIRKERSSVVSAVNSVVTAAASACRGKYSTFYSAGASISKGLAAGIRSGVASAKSAARELAQAAETAARAKLKINSPSKVFRAIGSGIPEGFVQGIKMMGSSVKRASESMANTAVSSTAKLMSRVYDIAMNDTDVQPTISPIVDLDNVKAGAEAINGLLGNDILLGTTAKMSAINTAMNRKNQNGTTEGVISAIDRLRKDLGKTGNTTYNVNGITYDDGSSVSEAIETLIRAAKIERRV